MLWSPLGQTFVGNFVGNKHRLSSQNDFHNFLNIEMASSKAIKSHPAKPRQGQTRSQKIAQQALLTKLQPFT
jgi:hypothetical protein